MSVDVLYDQSQWLIFFVLFGLLLIGGELGFWIGRRQRSSPPGLLRDQVGSIQGALFGLFALLLGFTFAMAVARFDLRKQMVIKESNAIGTAALRAELLPEAQRTEMAELFRRYVDIRIDVASRPNLFTPEIQELHAEAARLQSEAWQQATAAAEAAPGSVPLGLLLHSLNELIDVKGERDAALANHVPESVLMLLLGFAILLSGVLGYGNGLAGARALGAAAIFFALIAIVILVIVDLDRPGRGMIRVGQQAMIDLQKSLAGASP